MRSYDFNFCLSGKEFQDLARDILQIREKIIFESFAEGPDGGIDGRNVREDGYTTVFQAKRYTGMSSKILRTMKDERRKIDKLILRGNRVDRYILVLSEDISPEKKAKIVQIMSPYIINTKDVVMKSDMNNLLGMPEYKEIEARHHELWVPGINILNRQLFGIVNGSLVGRSKNCYENMLGKKKIFVETEIFRETLRKVQKNRVVIISGEPGVGKTTLAEQTALFFMGKYRSEIFLSVSSIDEIYTALTIEGKKVILYDDFWGSNGLVNFDLKSTSRELVKVIERINRKNDCILVMTTREYILEQGLKQNEELRRLIEQYKLECRITQYSDADKLKIYYGHLQSSGLTWEQTVTLKLVDDYVIHSLNYNPRVLELFFKKIEPDTTPKCCWEELRKYLECPMDFWEDTFHGLSKEASILYIIMAVLPMPVELIVLEECYNNYIKRNREVYEWKNFSDTVIELEKTILRTDLYHADGEGMIAVTFQNPSVKDFLIEFLRKNLVQYQDVLEGSCKYYAQYVEYLKILDKIDAPLGVYGKIFEKALEAIETDTIVFIERYEGLLRHNKELDKYYANYETDLDYREMGLGRMFQLLLLYKSGCGDKVESIVKDTFLCTMQDICRYPESVLREDLSMLPGVLIAMWQNGICREVLPALEICMSCLMRNRISIYEIGLQKQIPQVWDEYVEKHKNEISKYLEKYYAAEICTAAVEDDDDDEFFYQLNSCEECYKEYHMDIPESLKRKIELYDSWMGMNTEEESREEDIEREEQRQSVEEIKEKFQTDFLDGIHKKWISDFDEWLKEHHVSQNIKTELESIKRNDHALWREFTCDEDSLDFLGQIITYTGKLPENIKKAVEAVRSYMLEKSGLDDNELLKFVSFAEEMDTESHMGIWTEKQMRESCAELLFEHENLLSDMAEANILVNHEHWYRWPNYCLPLCARFEGWSSVDEKIRYYKNVQEKAADEDYFEGEEIIWELLYQEDCEYFKKYILVPTAGNVYEEIFIDNENWLNDFIEFLGYTYEFKGNEIIGSTSTVHDDFLLLETYLQLDLCEEIASVFDEKNINILREKNVIGSDAERISSVLLEEINKEGLLAELGIDKKLEQARRVIYECQKEEIYE